MERPRTVTITLLVEVDGDDVRGWARAEAARGAAGAIDPAPPVAGDPVGDAPRPFAGWLGLIGSIDALLGFASDAGADADAAQEGAPTR